MNVSIIRSLFYITTWGYLITNFLVAWISSLNLPLLALRESWMILLIIYLIINKRLFSLYIITFVFCIGAVPLIYSVNSNDYFGFIYGFRDILLIVLLIELLNDKSSSIIKLQEIDLFVKTILVIAFFDCILTNVLNINFLHEILRIDQYYVNKGVDINLSNGIMGDRIGSPLYSPNLLCTLIATVYFFDRRIKFGDHKSKIIAIMISFFTLTKVILVSLLFYFLGNRWKTPIIIGIIMIYPMYHIVVQIYNILEPSVLKYHLASVIGHLNAFSLTLQNSILSLIPEPLGSHSIMMKVRNDIDGAGIESSILARLSEIKIYYSVIVIYITYSLFKFNFDIYKKFIIFFLIISMLTATSNQPVAFIPALFLIRIFFKNE